MHADTRALSHTHTRLTSLLASGITTAVPEMVTLPDKHLTACISFFHILKIIFKWFLKFFLVLPGNDRQPVSPVLAPVRGSHRQALHSGPFAPVTALVG